MESRPPKPCRIPNRAEFSPIAAGFRLLIPGFAQWSWSQSERGLVLFGSFISALGVGLFTWGTWGGIFLLAFAFGAHVTSTADVIRHATFPGFGKLVPWVSASVGLGLGCYAPALAMASLMAWPGLQVKSPREGHLINRLAYKDQKPAAGDWVWLEPLDGRPPRMAKVLATSGQSVEWGEERLKVGGRAVPWVPSRSASPPRDMVFQVPEGRVLVSPEPVERPADPSEPGCGLELVEEAEVVGKVWASLYPIWNRRLIP